MIWKLFWNIYDSKMQSNLFSLSSARMSTVEYVVREERRSTSRAIYHAICTVSSLMFIKITKRTIPSRFQINFISSPKWWMDPKVIIHCGEHYHVGLTFIPVVIEKSYTSQKIWRAEEAKAIRRPPQKWLFALLERATRKHSFRFILNNVKWEILSMVFSLK